MIGVLKSSLLGLVAAGPGDPDGAAALRDQIAAFSQAYRVADVDTLAGLLTEDYVHINDGGAPLDKDQWLDWNRSRSGKLTSGDWRLDDYTVTELEIVLHGPTAVVTGRVHSAGMRAGQTFASDLRFLNLWVRQAGRWKRAAFFDARVRN